VGLSIGRYSDALQEQRDDDEEEEQNVCTRINMQSMYALLCT
jgi:hypothetical protein